MRSISGRRRVATHHAILTIAVQKQKSAKQKKKTKTMKRAVIIIVLGVVVLVVVVGNAIRQGEKQKEVKHVTLCLLAGLDAN